MPGTCTVKKLNVLPRPRRARCRIVLSLTKTKASLSGGDAHNVHTNGSDGDGTGGGLNWVTEAASGKPPKTEASLSSTTTTTADDALAAALSGKPIPAANRWATASTYSGNGNTDNVAESSLSWLLTAATSGSQHKKTTQKELPMAVLLATDACPHAAKKKSSALGGWIVAANESGNFGLSVDEDGNHRNSTKHTRSRSSVPPRDAKLGTAAAIASNASPGGWLTDAVTFGHLEAPGNQDNYGIDGNRDDVPSCTETATQTDEVTIAEVMVPKSTKPKLPPWAKPWIPPVPVADTSATSSADKKTPVSVEESKTRSPDGKGLDWIRTTVNGPLMSSHGEGTRFGL